MDAMTGTEQADSAPFPFWFLPVSSDPAIAAMYWRRELEVAERQLASVTSLLERLLQGDAGALTETDLLVGDGDQQRAFAEAVRLRYFHVAYGTELVRVVQEKLAALAEIPVVPDVPVAANPEAETVSQTTTTVEDPVEMPKQAPKPVQLSLF